jgi:5-(carboxyamino)imidazole ribonucleotide synthase
MSDTTIGILGAGQLGRMLALAGYSLGMRCRFLDPGPGSPASQLAPQIVAGYDDQEALARFVHGLDVVTYEFENVPLATVEQLARCVPVYPPPQALSAAQLRHGEKSQVELLGFEVPGYALVRSRAELDAALVRIGLPAVLKTNQFGYDGKGQALLRSPADVEAAWQQLGGPTLLVEEYVPFERELSLIAVRGRRGPTRCYPLVENVHRGGILRRSVAPASGVTPALQAQADNLAHELLATFDYVGVLAIELFQVGERLLFNEIAPRVHNSGHWTIEGAVTSQFENHLRAIAGLPLGATAARGVCGMLNLIGTLPEPSAVLAVPGAHLHLYGKAPRPGRKLGHVTVVAESYRELDERLGELEKLLGD